MARKKPQQPTSQPTIIEAMTGPFREWFVGADSWANWQTILKAAYGLPLTDSELTFLREVADRDPPGKRVRELWIIGGRRGGKDSIASLIMAHAASLFDGKRRQIAGITLPQLRRGERAKIFCLGGTAGLTWPQSKRTASHLLTRRSLLAGLCHQHLCVRGDDGVCKRRRRRKAPCV
jgi:hypothetical protein